MARPTEEDEVIKMKLVEAPKADPEQGKVTIPFFLPRVCPQSLCPYCSDDIQDESLDHARDYHEFSISKLAWAVQNGLSIKCIERYLSQYADSIIRLGLSASLKPSSGISRFPILFFAVERNSSELVRSLCRLGADPDTRAYPTDLPLLVYTIFSAEYQMVDTTATLIALLAAGADPQGVPKELWQDYLKAPARSAANESTDLVSLLKLRTVEVEDAFCRNMNLMQTYSLWKADKITRPLPRMKQFVDAFQSTPLFELPYHLIGQLPAAAQVLESITSHYLFGSAEPSESSKPLVLLFAGQSGHGKTEMATQMGYFLSLEMITVDCTEMNHETDIFGPKAPYCGYEEGSPLNNHLAKWSGQNNVVFLDEFDKTSNDVRKAMLLLFQSGAYKDRRNNQKLECSKTIWILATNFGESTINRFWSTHFKDREVENSDMTLFGSLDALLKRNFIAILGAPLTGRITAIVPFLPFTAGEQAVVVRKYMLKLANTVRQPIDTGSKKFAGHTHVNYINDGQIALHIGKQYYISEIGARSLETAVDTRIKYRLAHAIQSEPELVKDESNDQALARYDVRVATVLEDVEEITVKRVGSTELQLPSKTDQMPVATHVKEKKPKKPKGRGGPSWRPHFEPALDQ